MESRRFSQTLASEWQTVFVVSHKMPWCALLTAVKNYNKSLEKLQDFFFKSKTKTFIFVLEAPRDQDPGLEDYITGYDADDIFMKIRSLSFHVKFLIDR